MPKNTDITNALRLEQVLNVFLMVQDGTSLEESLRENDVARSTYYRWLPMAKEAKDVLDRAKHDVELIAYADILATKNRVLSQLLIDALAPITEPKDRLAILMYLDTRADILQDRNRPQSIAPDFLDGPTLIEAESKVLGGGVFDVTISKDEVTIKTNTPEIIDITPDDQNGISSGS